MKSTSFSAGNATVFNAFSGVSIPAATIHPSAINNPDLPGWIQDAVGAYSDVKLGMQYLLSRGMHTKFAYATRTRFMFPKMGGTWLWFKRGSSRLVNFGIITSGTFKQILTGSARAGLKAVALKVWNMAGANFALNFAFNFYENDFQLSWNMVWDTFIDTIIGTASTVLAAGVMSFVTAGVVAAGLSMPGIIVVGGVILLSMGIEWVIREVFDYPD